METKRNYSMRVSLILPHLKIPVWLRSIVAEFCELDSVELNVIFLAAESCPYKNGPFLFRAWKWFDISVFGRDTAKSQCTERLVELDDAFRAKCNCKFTNTSPKDIDDYLQDDGSDLIVWLAYDRPPADLIQVAKFGVLTLANATGAATGFWELVRRIPVTACELVLFDNGPEGDRVVATGFVATDRLSLCRSLVAVRVRDLRLLITMIEQVCRNSDALLKRAMPATSICSAEKAPGLMQLIGGIARIYGRYIVDLAKRPFFFEQWQLAYRVGGERLSQHGLTRLAPEHQGFWADPFVVRREGRTMIFFEELPEERPRGKIAVIEIQANGSAGPPSIVLERDYHLSYPFLLEYEGALFMVPEAAESGRVEAFRCTRFPDQWESYAVLLDGVHAFDPTLIKHDGLWWMFVTIQNNGNSTDDELHLFYASSPFEKWTSHPLNPICTDVRLARPGGALYIEQGQLYRPAQDCSVRYGFAISIQKILRMNTQEYEEVEAGKILPDWAPDALGTHTINHSNGVTVYDCIVSCRK